MEESMFARFKIKRERRKITREDRKYLEARVRRFLNRYLSASEADKDRYYDVVAGAAAACQPENVVLYSENLTVAEIAAEAASTVIRRRMLVGNDNPENRTDAFVMDAYATVAVGYRRAAGIYVRDKEMQSLGTAAVHLLTMATSRRMAKSKHESPEVSAPSCTTSSNQLTESCCEHG
jgi:hypothetical protein